MSVDSSSVQSRSSTTSSKSRSGKSLSEKIRDLGINLRPVKKSTSRVTLQYLNIKTEFYHPSNVAIMIPTLNLEQIVYYQPEIILDRTFPKKTIYKIEKFETTSPGPKNASKISDIEVKSFKPLKKMKFRKKKRHSSIINKIGEILNKGKGPLPSRDPSEESLSSNYGMTHEPVKVINDLPENILQKIFLHFNLQERNVILAKVCKSWYYMLKDPMFWTELQFSSNKVKTQVIIELIKRYPSLRKLSLNAVPNSVEILQELCRCNHNITHLAIKHCPVSSQDFARIILHVIACCKDLEVLNIKGMRFQSHRFFLELGRLKRLKSINLTGNKSIRSQDLITLSLNCRTLQELRIFDMNSDNKQGTCLRNEDVAFVISHLQGNLLTLKMDMQLLKNLSYQVFYEKLRLQFSQMQNITPLVKARISLYMKKASNIMNLVLPSEAVIKCTGLRCLGLKNCLYLSSEVFQQFIELKNLRKLKITRAINLKPEDFHFVFSNECMHKIEDLDVNGCWGVGEIGLQAITRGHDSLKFLSLKNCKSIKGNHLVHLSSCPNLIHLNIAHTEVDAAHLLSLSQHAKKLQSLVIDISMLKKLILQQLRKQFPFLKLRVSCSEFKKCETPFTDF